MDIEIVCFIINIKINGTTIILQIVQILRKRLLISRLRIALPNKILIENINVLKAEIDKEYIEDSNNLFENIKWELKSEINQNIKDNNQLDTDTYIIKDFPWKSKCAIKPYLKLLVNKTEKSRKLSFYKPEMYYDLQNKIQIN